MLIATTTVTIERPDGTGDPYEAASVATVASGVRAHISAPSGSDQNVGGDKVVIDAVAYLPRGTSLVRSDLITDDTSGNTYEVVWQFARQGLGLDHVQLGLRFVEGGSNG